MSLHSPTEPLQEILSTEVIGGVTVAGAGILALGFFAVAWGISSITSRVRQKLRGIF